MWALLLGAGAHSLTFVIVLCNDGFSGHLVRWTFHALLSTRSLDHILLSDDHGGSVFLCLVKQAISAHV